MTNKNGYTPEEQRLTDDLNALATLDLPWDALLALRESLTTIRAQRRSLRSAEVLEAIGLILDGDNPDDDAAVDAA